MLQILELVVQLAHASAAGDRLVQHRPAGHFLDVLPEIADRHPRGTDTSPSSGCSSPTIILKMVVFPAPFGPDETDLFTGIQLKGGVDEENLAAVLFAEVGERDQFTILNRKLKTSGLSTTLRNESKPRLAGDRAGEAKERRSRRAAARADPHEVVVRRVEARRLVDRHPLQRREPLPDSALVLGEDNFQHPTVDRPRQGVAARQVVGTGCWS